MGGGGGATVNVEPISKDAAACWGVEAVKEHNTAQDPVTQAYSVVLGLIGTVGLVRQWNALDRSLDLSQRQVDVAEDYYALSERNYTDITLSAYTCQKEMFEEYTGQFMDFGRKFVRCAANADYTCRHYVADYALYEGRATAGVGEQFSRLRQRLARQRSKYGTGACCAENLQLDIGMAMSLTDAANRGYRYEDQRKLQYDQWYWQQYTQAAEFVGAMRAHVISGVNSGVANATGGLSAIGGAVGQMGQSVGNQMQALENMASFWGSVSNGAFGLMGSMAGYNSISGGSQFNLPFSGGPSNQSTSPFLGAQSAGPAYNGGGKLSPVGTAIGEPTVTMGGPNVGYSVNSGYFKY